MKINTNRIPPEGLILEQDLVASSLDLETEIIKFPGPVKLKAHISKITNTVTLDMALEAIAQTNCSRCLNEFEISLKKNLKLSYPVDKSESVIDLSADIREELILDYPLKPLCYPDCKGLCLKCGKNLNEGGCNCGVT